MLNTTSRIAPAPLDSGIGQNSAEPPHFSSLSHPLSLSLLHALHFSESTTLLERGWFASGKCIVLMFDHCNYGQGPASHLSSLVDGLPKESRVLLE